MTRFLQRTGPGVALFFLCAAPPAWADYQDLVTRALTLDRTLADLERSARNAEVRALKQALTLRQPRFEVTTGEWAASTEGASAAPAVSGSVPLVGSEALARGTLSETAALAAAQDAVADRRLEVERWLIERLRTLAQAQIAQARADRALVAATRERDRARSVDGAAHQGGADLVRERAVRTAARDKRAADSEVRKAKDELARGTGVGLGSLPEVPSVDLGLGTVEGARGVLRARRAVQEARDQAGSPAPSVALFWSLGTVWSSVGDENHGLRAQTRDGVRVEADGWSAVAGVSVSQVVSAGSAPSASVTLSATWSPAAAQIQDLEQRERQLTLEGALAAEALARDLAARSLEELSARILELRLTETEAEQDLTDAHRQSNLAAAWQGEGVVGDAEVDEARAALAEAQAAVTLARLDWLLWDLDRRVVGGAQEAPHEN